MSENINDATPDLAEESLNSLLNSSTAPLTNKVPLESLSNLFKAPDSSQFVYSSSYGESFERYKVKVDLLKWLIGTVGLTLITFIINWGFRDREQGMNEISQYDKYATELIILNDNPVNRRMLAQFFSKVTPSEKLKQGWIDYYYEVNKEYSQFLRNDSLVKSRLNELTKKDSTKLTSSEKQEIQKLEEKSTEFDKIKNAPTITPNLSNNSNQAVVYIQSINTSKENAENIKTILLQTGFKIPAIEFMNKEKYALKGNEIRYYNENDLPNVNEIRSILNSNNIETNVRYLPKLRSKVQEGTIELWLQ